MWTTNHVIERDAVTSNGDIRGRNHLKIRGQIWWGGYLAVGGNAHWHDGPGAGAAKDW